MKDLKNSMDMIQSKNELIQPLLNRGEYARASIFKIAESFGFHGIEGIAKFVKYGANLLGQIEFTWNYEDYCRIYEIDNSPLGQALK